MEQAKLKEIKAYINLEYDKTDESIFSMMKMYFEGECSIEELYNFLEDKGVLYPFSDCAPTSKDVAITEEDLKYYIKNTVLNISKEEKEETI